MESQLNPAESRGEKILALFPGALGDFVCFLPALEFLARRAPVDLLARSEYADLAPSAVEVGSLERREVSRLFVPGAAAEEPLKRYFDSYSAVYSWHGRADENFSRAVRALVGARGKLFRFRPEGGGCHIVDYYLDCVGAPRRRAAVAIPIKPEALVWRRRWLETRGLTGKKILALAPGSGAKKKNWPAEYFRRVAAWWERETEGRSILILGPAEKALALDPWSDLCVVSGLTLGRLAALLSGSDVYLGNDSGVTHLAARLGVETVALFGPSDPGTWAPRGARVTVLGRGVACAACARDAMKSCPHRNRLAELAPEGIIEILSALGARASGKFHLLDKGVGSH